MNYEHFMKDGLCWVFGKTKLVQQLRFIVHDHECQVQVFELAFRREFLRLWKLDIKFKLILFYII